MIGGDRGTFDDVLQLVERWRPSEAYSHEREFQSELQSYLDERLNQGSGLLDAGQSYAVSTERGASRGDVVVDDVVGIELKRDFSNSQKKKLRGQLEDYADHYQFVIACACGIDDMDGWRELERKYANQTGGLGLDQMEFAFVHKKRSNFGTESDDGGLLGDDGLL